MSCVSDVIDSLVFFPIFGACLVGIKGVRTVPGLAPFLQKLTAKYFPKLK